MQSDYEFLRNSKIEVDHIKQSIDTDKLSNYKVRLTNALQSKQNYLELLESKHDTYRYAEEQSDHSDEEELSMLNPHEQKMSSKVRKSARIERDLKRIGIEDEFSDISYRSKAVLSSYYPSKKTKRDMNNFYNDTVDHELAL